MQVFVTHFHHIVLNGANDNENEETTERDLGNGAFRVPSDVLQQLCGEEIERRIVYNREQVGLTKCLQFDEHFC